MTSLVIEKDACEDEGEIIKLLVWELPADLWISPRAEGPSVQLTNQLTQPQNIKTVKSVDNCANAVIFHEDDKCR